MKSAGCIPSGFSTQLWNISMFNRYTSRSGSFSIVMLNYRMAYLKLWRPQNGSVHPRGLMVKNAMGIKEKPFRIPFFLDSLRWLIKNHEKWLTFDAVSIIPRKKALLMVKPRWIPRRARIDGSILPFPARLEDFRPDAHRSHGDKARRSAMFKVAHG